MIKVLQSIISTFNLDGFGKYLYAGRIWLGFDIPDLLQDSDTLSHPINFKQYGAQKTGTTIIHGQIKKN